MKIIYCIAGTFNSGGMERVLANKANYLIEHNYEVVIITTDQKGREPFFNLSPQIRCFDLAINYSENNGQHFFHKLLHYPYKQWRHRKKLNRLLKIEKADIVVSMFCNDVSFIWKIEDDSKKILEIHFSKFKYLQYNRKGLWRLVDLYRNWHDLFLVSKFDKFIVLTNEDKRDWGNLSNIDVIANAKSDLGHCIAALDDQIVLAIGRYDYQKGFDMLIKSWSIIHERFPEWKLKIVGDGELRDKLDFQIRELGLSTVIELKGATSDILADYLTASFLVLSSRYEGLPMVLLEAMSVGLPVVSFECKCGPKDIITNGVDGVLVPAENIPALANEIMWMIEHPKESRVMREKALEKSAHYSLEYIMLKWESLFESLVLTSNNE